jgi:hypothetical protein
VYGKPRRELRNVFWDRLRFLKTQWNSPWFCAGDFNEIMSADEQLGPKDRNEAQMDLFRDYFG